MLNRLIGYVRDTVEELVRIENEIKKENLSINELKNLAFVISLRARRIEKLRVQESVALIVFLHHFAFYFQLQS